MANVEHSALTGSNLHEPKGANTAAVSTVYVSDGVGSGSWTTLGVASLTTTAKAFQGQLFNVVDSKGSGTSGGTFTSGAWQTRTLNTTVTNEIAGASLASNQITLPAGTYHARAIAPAIQVDGHAAKLRNITDGSDTLYGSVSFSNRGAPYAQTDSIMENRFTIASPKTFELQHKCITTVSTYGFGLAATLGISEIYAQVWIWKVA